MSDIVDGLRSVSGDTTGIAKAAAHEIERLRARVAELEAAKAFDVDALYAAIAHGDDEHRAWLKDAMHDFSKGLPVFPPSIKPEPAKVADDVVRDAERYRYLRNRRASDVLEGAGTAAGVWIDCEDDSGTLVLLTGPDADIAIDAAMLSAAARKGDNHDG